MSPEALPQRPARWPGHPLPDVLALLTLAAGLVAFATGAVREAHFVASCVGAGAFLLGLYSQLVSETTGERWFNVIGTGLAFVGLGLGLVHGGFAL